MALIYQGMLEDFPEKSAGRATLSLVGFDMMIWGVSWGCCGSGAWSCLGGTMGAGPTRGMQ